jgi:NAD(P)-dependent dehydrogenase (short-subunit alcohol dehydrogenase family)
MIRRYGLEGKIGLVTGAGSGIGREVARVCAEEGVVQALVDINEADLHETAHLIQETGSEFELFLADVSERASMNRVFETIEGKWSRLDILVTCAGIASRERTWDISDEVWDRLLDVNLKGTFISVQGALRLMRKQQSGKIVTIGSDSGKRGGGAFAGSHYAAAKGGVLAFTRTVAKEVAMEGISVNCVNPGPTRTPIHKGITEEQTKMRSAAIPRGRLGEPREIANVIVFLVSDLASWIYGETVNVDGGLVMD